MSDLLKTQTCPYCDHEVEDSNAEWGEGEHTVKCDGCKEEYSVEPVYQFKGFKTQKYCHACGEWEEDCYCDVEDEE